MEWFIHYNDTSKDLDVYVKKVEQGPKKSCSTTDVINNLAVKYNCNSGLLDRKISLPLTSQYYIVNITIKNNEGLNTPRFYFLVFTERHQQCIAIASYIDRVSCSIDSNKITI